MNNGHEKEKKTWQRGVLLDKVMHYVYDML
jgi:hypothetical protein